MKRPGAAIRAGAAKANTMGRNAVHSIDRGTRRNGWFRSGLGLGVFVWAQVELTDWLASSSSAVNNNEVMANVAANGVTAEVGALALSAVANKVAPNSNPWLRRATIVAIGGPLTFAANVLFRHYALDQEVLPGPFLDTEVRDLLVLAVPTAVGSATGSFLVAPRPEAHGRPAAPQLAPAHA